MSAAWLRFSSHIKKIGKSDKGAENRKCICIFFYKKKILHNWNDLSVEVKSNYSRPGMLAYDLLWFVTCHLWFSKWQLWIHIEVMAVNSGKCHATLRVNAYVGLRIYCGRFRGICSMSSRVEEDALSFPSHSIKSPLRRHKRSLVNTKFPFLLTCSVVLPEILGSLA